MQTLTKAPTRSYARRAVGRAPLKPARRTGALPTSWWFALEFMFLASGSIFLILNKPESIDSVRCMLALAIIWLGLAPTVIYLHSRNRPSTPIFPLVGIFYATNYGLPIFASGLQRDDQTSFLFIEDVTETSLWLALSGIVCMLIAYYASSNTRWGTKKKLRIVGDWTSTRFRMLLWMCLGAHLVCRVIPVIRDISTISHLLDPLGYLAFGMFFFIAKERKLPSVEFFIVWALLFPIEFIFRLITGSLAQTVTFGIYMSLISYRHIPKLSVTFVGLAMALFLFFNPVKNYYRMITWGQAETDFSFGGTISKLEVFFLLAYDYHFGNTLFNQVDKPNTYGDLAGRVSCISVFSLVVDETPAYIPYWGGETYKPLFTKWVPRIIWPDKPIDDTGQQFGHRYRLLDDRDETTAINLPWMVEMYANFGQIGVLVGMCIVGIMLSSLDQILNRANSNPVEMSFGTIILMSFIYQESSFSLMVGDTILLFFSVLIPLKITLNQSRSPKI